MILSTDFEGDNYGASSYDHKIINTSRCKMGNWSMFCVLGVREIEFMQTVEWQPVNSNGAPDNTVLLHVSRSIFSWFRSLLIAIENAWSRGSLMSQQLNFFVILTCESIRQDIYLLFTLNKRQNRMLFVACLKSVGPRGRGTHWWALKVVTLEKSLRLGR